MRPLRSPLVHFILLGGLLFLGQPLLERATTPPAETEAKPESTRRIALSDERLAEMRRTFSEQMGRAPNAVESERMIAAEVDEEILYREAIARGLLERDGGVQTRLIQKMLFLDGEAHIDEAPALLRRAVELELHEGDLVVRRILVQKMRLLAGRLREEQNPRPEEIEAVYAEEREALRAPDRRTLVHVFLSRDRHGAETQKRAAEIAARLRESGNAPPSSATMAEGDPFPLGHHLARRSQKDLERVFGGTFGEKVYALAPGHWSEPIESAYGFHVVRVESTEPGEVPPLEIVSTRLRLQLEEARRSANVAAHLRALRREYEVILPHDQEPG